MSRTCQELGVCQQRTPACQGCEPVNASANLPAPVPPAKPRTAWVFKVVLENRELIVLSIVLALAYMAARS